MIARQTGGEVNVMRKICGHLEKVLYAVAMCSVALFFFCTSLQVFSRAAGINLPFTEELANAALAWCCFVGGAAMIHTDEHFKFTAFTEKLSGKKLMAVNVAVQVLVLLFNIVVACYGVKLVRQFWNWRMTTLPFSKGWAWICVPVFGFSGVLFSLEQIVDNITHPERHKVLNAVDEAIKEAEL